MIVSFHTFLNLQPLYVECKQFDAGEDIDMNLIDKHKQIIYMLNAVLSVEREFRGNYEIPDIANSVQRVTRIAVVYDERKRTLKKSSVGWFLFVIRWGTYVLLTKS